MTIKKILILGAAGLLASTAVQAQSLGEKTGANSVIGISPSTQDFVTEAANSDMLEIESSKLASTKNDTKDKSFADQMVKDHTETTAKVKALVASGKVKAALPSQMASSYQSKLDKLKGLNGDDFRKEYESMQVSAHKDAVSLFERYGKGGDNADLKAFANDTLPTLKHHLEMAQALDKAK
jgi:putative membrane protein